MGIVVTAGVAAANASLCIARGHQTPRRRGDFRYADTVVEILSVDVAEIPVDAIAEMIRPFGIRTLILRAAKHLGNVVRHLEIGAGDLTISFPDVFHQKIGPGLPGRARRLRRFDPRLRGPGVVGVEIHLHADPDLLQVVETLRAVCRVLHLAQRGQQHPREDGDDGDDDEQFDQSESLQV